MRHVKPVTPFRVCKTCGVEKPISEYRPWTTLGGHTAYEQSCLVCTKERSRLNARKYDRDNAEVISKKRADQYAADENVRQYAIAKSHNYYHSNREKCIQRQKQYVAANRDKVKKAARRLHLLSKYGITQQDYESMLQQQDGKCAICGTLNPGSRGVFHIDHCHASGVVRGLLCHHCNKGLGQFKDNIDVLLMAVSYLSKTALTQEEF